MKFVASLVLAFGMISAAHAAAQYSTNASAQPLTPGVGRTGPAVQNLDLNRLVLLPGPYLESVHPSAFATGPIPSLGATNPPAFLHKYTPPAFELVTTNVNVQHMRTRVTAPEAVKEFSTPRLRDTPTPLQFDHRLPPPPSAQTPRGQKATGAIVLPDSDDIN